MEDENFQAHVICAWCKSVMKLIDGKESIDEGDKISHGICNDCKNNQINVLKRIRY